MATLTGSVQNLSGLLYDAQDVSTPFLDAVYNRGRNGGRRLTFSQEFVLSNSTQMLPPSQPSFSELDTLIAPTPDTFTREQDYNIAQPFHRSIAVSYMKQSNFNAMDGLNLANAQNNTPNEFNFQRDRAVKQIRLDLNYTIINGAFQFLRGDSTVEPMTRGLLEGVQTNLFVDSGAAPDKNRINEALNEAIANGLVPEGLEIWVNPAMISPITDNWIIIPGSALPASRTDGGVSYTNIMTDFGTMPIYHDRMIEDGILAFVAMGELAVAEKPYSPVGVSESMFGALYYEPLAKVGAAETGQVYGEMGFDYAAEFLHMVLDLR